MKHFDLIIKIANDRKMFYEKRENGVYPTVYPFSDYIRKTYEDVMEAEKIIAELDSKDK